MTITGLAHPMVGLVAGLGSALDELALVQPVFLSTEEKAAMLRELAVAEARLAEVRLRVMAAAGDVADAESARDVATWWSHHTRCDPGAARADAGLAEALDRRWPQVAAGLAAGGVSVEQARVIVSALEDLPTSVAQETLTQAESTLVGYAASFRPAQLRRLGRRILDVVAPEVAEQAEARRLAELEAGADRETRLSLRQRGDGTTRLSGVLPDAAAARLRTYLEAFTSPRQEQPGDTGPALGGADAPGSEAALPGAAFVMPAAAPEVRRLPYGRRLGLAFCGLLEHLDPAALPDHGGDATTVIVTIGLEQLRSELATADLLDLERGETEEQAGSSGGGNLTAAQARRLACTARIIPAVLGGDGEILDLGRARRLFSPAQRKALRLRDRRCRAEGCTIPATWCEAHHRDPWSSGGRTDLADGVLLCSFHHHRAHDPRYTADRLPSGDLRYTRRT